ncbi:MAG: sigma-70 family RNA polymerase sigma factor [Phycisphaerales bacterium]|nr:sigma-70 family RNA polymerase sigma factor [Phycisphaerales bacterium]
MPDDHPTSWTLIGGAAHGECAARDRFARRYEPSIRAYLCARWAGNSLTEAVDDAVQDVFVECFRAGGVLQRVDASAEGGFRAFLLGVTRNVARRIEARRRPHPQGDSVLSEASADDPRLSRCFDREWARSLMLQARERQSVAAAQQGEAARRRLELLELRFSGNLPIREVALRWGVDAAGLHRQYARARREFREALLAVLRDHGAAAPEQEAAGLLELLRGE